MGCQKQCYDICVEEHLTAEWFEKSGEVSVRSLLDDSGLPVTVLHCRWLDQSALHGLLARVRDMGLTLCYVRRCS